MQVLVELRSVEPGETASIDRGELADRGEVVHAAEDSPVDGLSDGELVVGEVAEAVTGQAFVGERCGDELGDKRSGRTQRPGTDVGADWRAARPGELGP